MDAYRRLRVALVVTAVGVIGWTAIIGGSTIGDSGPSGALLVVFGAVAIVGFVDMMIEARRLSGGEAQLRRHGVGAVATFHGSGPTGLRSNSGGFSFHAQRIQRIRLSVERPGDPEYTAYAYSRGVVSSREVGDRVKVWVHPRNRHRVSIEWSGSPDTEAAATTDHT